MEGRRPRAELVPNANNPRLLLRLVGFVATGIRRAGPLAELLEVELRTVHYYTQAAEWLGLLEVEGELRLTPRGLALAFSEPEAQKQLYAEAVWSNPLAALVMGARDALPTADEIAVLVAHREPTLAPATARRRASALRSLLAPAFARRPDPRRGQGAQLALPFPRARPPPEPAPVDLRAGLEESPDVYRRLLTTLLDHGELSTGQVRSVLDEMGGRDAPLGAYIDMAIRRGDAWRIDEKLVASRGAARRREVVEDSALVALTDPLYREYLAGLDAATAALARTRSGQASPEDVQLRSRLSRLSARFSAWDLRVFGRRLQPGEADQAAGGLLLGRRLAGMPQAGPVGEPLPETTGPFVDCLDQPGLAICMPRALLGLRGGVATVNRRLAADRAAPAGVRMPGPMDPRLRVHGGLVAPGEDAPRAVPDNLSLRLRALTHAPALALLAVALLAGRRGADRPQLRVAGPDDPPVLRRCGRDEGPLLPLMERFAEAQGWVVLRPPCGGLSDPELASLAEELGLATRASGRLLLDEALFARLQEDPECRLVYEALLPLEDRLLGWLEGP